MINQQGSNPVAISIWLLAFGYFAFYIPYSALIKALSSGFLVSYGVNSTPQSINVMAFLPLVLVATVVTMPLIIYCLGWYRFFENNAGELKRDYPAGESHVDNHVGNNDDNHVGNNGGNHCDNSQRIFGLSRWAVCSGLAFAVIIVTTTLAYSFVGVSIVFALLLMRGGVLVMSPLVDRLSKREVHWYSWAGLGLSLTAVGIALAQVNEYHLDFIVLLNLGAYLTGYIFRLRQMSHYAKDAQESLNRRFFVEENTVAMLALLFVAAFTLLYHLFSSSIALTDYIAIMLASGVIWPALLIGFFYGVLGVFGSMIYLNRRENTFSIPVNRCASLLSGVCASFLLLFLFDGQSISPVQIVSALAISLALFFMSFFDLRQILHHQHSVDNPMQRIWLFICDGNRMRSPMAAAICNKVLEHHFKELNLGKGTGASTDTSAAVNENDRDIYADSAALQLGQNRNMPDAAIDALAEFDIRLDDHQAQQISESQLHRAEKIYCMSKHQCDLLIAQFPWTAAKVVNLGGEAEIAKPLGADKQHFIALASLLHLHIKPLLTVLGQDDAQDTEPGIELEQNHV